MRSRILLMSAVSALVALVAFVVAGCGSSSTKTVTVTPTPGASDYVPASTSTTTATTSSRSTTSSLTSSTTTAAVRAVKTVRLATFKSPSGNIGCMIIAGNARCGIKQRSWSPPRRPARCPREVDFGQGLIVGGSGPGRLVCAGDTTLDPAAKPLAYDTDTVIGSLRCQSRTAGVTCVNVHTSHGFFISIQAYRAF